MKNIFLLIFLMSACFAKTCTYENDDFWVSIKSLCEEGELSCQNVSYTAINKKNQSLIFLKGKALNDTNYNFIGFEFKNGIFLYRINDRANLVLQIYKKNKLIYEKDLEYCKE